MGFGERINNININDLLLMFISFFIPICISIYISIFIFICWEAAGSLLAAC